MESATQLIAVSNKDFYPITMKQDTEVLDEVVVTALGIKRAEKALSYNVQQIKSEDITGIKDANFINSLNGKIAGVSINKSGSGVGGATRVVMRGAKSIEGDNMLPASRSSNAPHMIRTASATSSKIKIIVVNSSSSSMSAAQHAKQQFCH